MSLSSLYYSAMSALFSPVFSLPLFLAELIIIFITVVFSSITFRLLFKDEDIKNMEEAKRKQKELMKQAEEIKKTDPKKANEMMRGSIGLQKGGTSRMMKASYPGMLFGLLLLPWVSLTFSKVAIALPIVILGKSSIGWIGWYLMNSLPLSLLFRKLMGVNV
jgi:uncharacterized membrane protein (DUF106 family)